MKPATETTRRVDRATADAIEEWIADEAALLDGREFRRWGELLADDFSYQIPQPVTWDNPERPPYDANELIIDETRQSIELWIRRYDPGVIDNAWGENPPPRTRHFVSNTRAWHTDRDDEYAVEANVLLSWTILAEPSTFVSANRHDVLRTDGNGAFKLARRLVLLDQSVITTLNLRLIL